MDPKSTKLYAEMSDDEQNALIRDVIMNRAKDSYYKAEEARWAANLARWTGNLSKVVDQERLQRAYMDGAGGEVTPGRFWQEEFLRKEHTHGQLQRGIGRAWSIAKSVLVVVIVSEIVHALLSALVS